MCGSRTRPRWKPAGGNGGFRYFFFFFGGSKGNPGSSNPARPADRACIRLPDDAERLGSERSGQTRRSARQRPADRSSRAGGAQTPAAARRPARAGGAPRRPGRRKRRDARVPATYWRRPVRHDLGLDGLARQAGRSRAVAPGQPERQEPASTLGLQLVHYFFFFFIFFFFVFFIFRRGHAGRGVELIAGRERSASTRSSGCNGASQARAAAEDQPSRPP